MSPGVHGGRDDDPDASGPDVDGEPAWTRHTTGLLGPTSGKTPPPDQELTVWPPQGAVEVDLTGAYDGLAEGGLAYGPAFRGVRSVWRRGNELFAEVRLSEGESAGADRFGIHPALLDEALHAALLTGSTAPTQALRVHFPFSIRFNLGDVGGPSAGLAFALELFEKRGRDVDHGYKVAATGEMQLNGSVTRIGGIKQKTIGARKSHVDVFLVPVDGDNARDAKRYAGGLRIIPVKSFQQALQALATLPPKS